MPAWADADPADYWDAADLYDRANARLYVSADFALPRDLDADDQVELVHAFAQELTADEQLPYTLAIHAGRDRDGREHNPHAHLMISERQNDGIARERQQWFKRADRAHPERGGAPKTRGFHGREWVEHARERWAELTNAMLERNGRIERVDHRSNERQGIDREPGEHFGPAAAHMANRGIQHERLSAVAEAASTAERLEQIERVLAVIVGGGGRGGPTLDNGPDEREHRERFSGSERTEDWSTREVVMPSALDTFRAQQDAADAVYARLQEVSDLLGLRKQADALQRTDELKQLLEREERWLSETRRTVIEVQRWRENDAHRFWRGVVVRWVVAAAFAIAAAAAAGVGYAAFTKPYDRELAQLRDQAALGRFVEQRALSLSVSERREFDALMRWPRRNLKRQPGKQ